MQPRGQGRIKSQHRHLLDECCVMAGRDFAHAKQIYHLPASTHSVKTKCRSVKRAGKPDLPVEIGNPANRLVTFAGSDRLRSFVGPGGRSLQRFAECGDIGGNRGAGVLAHISLLCCKHWTDGATAALFKRFRSSYSDYDCEPLASSRSEDHRTDRHEAKRESGTAHHR